MKAKLTDISMLFVGEMISQNLSFENCHVIWYRSNDIYDVESLDVVDRIKNKLEIFSELDECGFSEYKYIICASIQFFDETIEDSSDSSDSESDDDNYQDKKHLQVMVDEKSKYAKNNFSDDLGFIRLFTLLIEWENINEENYYTIKHISINEKLVCERIELCQNDKYLVLLENFDDDDTTNESECSICLISNGPMIETECGHKYHLSCLKCVPNLLCPLCRSDVSACLKNNGISETEIEFRKNKYKNEIESENLCAAIDQVEIEKLSELDFVRLCMENLKLNGGDIISYFDLTFDMNTNAINIFSKISHMKSKKEKGVFVYMYDSPVEFITQIKNPQSKSIVSWQPISDFSGTPLYEVVKNRTDRITDPSNEYVVLIMIENVVNAHIINKNTHPENYRIRIHQRDILNSIIKCVRCRCSGNSPNSLNREHKWAKDKWNNMMKKEKAGKNRRKNQRKTKTKAPLNWA